MRSPCNCIRFGRVNIRFQGKINNMMEAENNEFIRLDDIWKSFYEGTQTREVLKGCSATFKRGEFVAIIGKSGSGKSTLLNLISGIDLLEAGSISLNGQNLTTMDENQRTIFRRQKIGFVFQSYNLLPRTSALKNLMVPMRYGEVAENEREKRH